MGCHVYPGLHPGLVCGAPLGRWLKYPILGRNVQTPDPGLHPGLICGAPLGRSGHLFETKSPNSSCEPEACAPNRVAAVFLTIQLTHTKPGSTLYLPHRLTHPSLLLAVSDRYLPGGIRASQPYFLRLLRRRNSSVSPFYMFGPSFRSPELLCPRLTSAGSSQRLSTTLTLRQTDRSPRVLRTQLPAYARRIYVTTFRAGIGL